MSPEDSLLERLKEGNSAAFDWLVGHFEAPLFRFFVCDHRDYHLAQEQTSETFVQLVQSLPAMKGNSEKLRAFVFAIARHVKLREWRRPKPASSSIEYARDICDPRPSPAE